MLQATYGLLQLKFDLLQPTFGLLQLTFDVSEFDRYDDSFICTIYGINVYFHLPSILLANAFIHLAV